MERRPQYVLPKRRDAPAQALTPGDRTIAALIFFLPLLEERHGERLYVKRLMDISGKLRRVLFHDLEEQPMQPASVENRHTGGIFRPQPIDDSADHLPHSLLRRIFQNFNSISISSVSRSRIAIFSSVIKAMVALPSSRFDRDGEPGLTNTVAPRFSRTFV